MAQAVPATLFQAQALKLLTDLRSAYQSGVGTVDDLSTRLRDILTTYEQTAGAPFFAFETFVEGEPPLSAKINRIWENLQHDINILQQQVDIGRAAAVLTHNLIATEVLKSKQENARVSNKLKTLQLYSDAVDSNVIVFGDHFHDAEFIDLTRVPSGQQAIILGESYVVIPREGTFDDFTGNSTVTILPTSNGLAGNLHEVRDDTEGDVVFKAEGNPQSDLLAAIDAEPNTWFEYESVLVSETDRRTAGNFNFSYQGNAGEKVDWAAGPAGGLLHLDLEFDLGSPQSINNIAYVPFNLEDNANYAVKVAKIQISKDGTDWEELRPRDVFVGSTPNLQAARSADDVVTGQAIWVFAAKVVRFVRVFLEQSQSLTRRIGHIYYEDSAGQRVDSIPPLLSRPEAAYQPDLFNVGEHVQKRELFDAQRWVIGIRDITISRLNFAAQGTLVTKPLRVGGVVDRVLLDADATVPPEYDASQQWVAFYISPDDGANWYPISRVQDDFLGIPEELAFNDPVSEAFREPGVGYQSVSSPVTAVRLKAVLSRPADLSSTSPVLHSYKLKVSKR